VSSPPPWARSLHSPLTTDNSRLPLVVQTTCVLLAIGVTAAWPYLRGSGAIIAFALSYGFFSGAFLSLVSPCVAVLTKDMSVMGMRMGLVFALSGFGLLTGNPLAGILVSTVSYKAAAVWALAAMGLGAGILGVAAGLEEK